MNVVFLRSPCVRSTLSRAHHDLKQIITSPKWYVFNLFVLLLKLLNSYVYGNEGCKNQMNKCCESYLRGTNNIPLNFPKSYLRRTLRVLNRYLCHTYKILNYDVHSTYEVLRCTYEIPLLYLRHFYTVPKTILRCN